MSKQIGWVTRWGMEMADTPSLPGVWRRRAGGHVVRSRVTHARTGKLVEILRALPDEPDPKKALAWLTLERERVRCGTPEGQTEIPTFKKFATSVYKAKVEAGEIASAKGREKWGTALEHHLFTAPFATYLIDRITPADVSDWRDSLPSKTWKRVKIDKKTGEETVIKTSTYSPLTLNDWLAVARVIFKAAKIKFSLVRDPMEGIADISTKTHRTYTREEPNALTPAETGKWLATFRELYPQHYAMTFLGLALGHRPSTLRPIRRQGPYSDLDLRTRKLLIRRSHTRGQEVMDATKTFNDQEITLPKAVIEILKWHVRTQLVTPKQKASELLFPTDDGGIRSASCLQKPFDVVTAACKIGKTITPRAMRRTFQDLTRAAAVDGIVAKAISGHATDAMRVHYSTAQDAEVERAIGKVIDIAKARAKRTTKKRKAG